MAQLLVFSTRNNQSSGSSPRSTIVSPASRTASPIASGTPWVRNAIEYFHVMYQSGNEPEKGEDKAAHENERREYQQDDCQPGESEITAE